MSIPDKQTVSLDQEELGILDAIRRLAPKHKIEPKLAQTYGVWTVCFRRYCEEESVPWLWMSSVSDFMDFLDTHPNVSAGERNRALDGIMFYITDVHKARQNQEQKEKEAERKESIPSSTQSLFAQMLLRYDVPLTSALRLRREDVRLDDATISFPSTEENSTQVLSVSSTLHEGLKKHLRRVKDRSDSSNPRLFGPDNIDERRGDDTEEDLDRSTEVATRVMKAFGDPDDAPDDEE
jgi:hypothetical protein